MSKINLPVKMPLFTTFHNIASAGIVAKNNPMSDIWYYNNVIQWRCIEPTDQYSKLDLAVCRGSIWDIPFIDKTETNFRFIHKYIIEIIEEMIAENCYVLFSGVDDYFIENKTNYQKKHFSHDGLITGVDSEHRMLAMVAYDKNGIYRAFETSYDGFIKGVEYLCEDGEYGNLTTAELNSRTQCILDISSIKKELKLYLDGYVEYGSFTNIPITVVYGFPVYDSIILYIDRFLDGSLKIERLDQRIFRLLYEHKNCMWLRIRCIESDLGLGDKYSKLYSEVLDFSKKVKMLAIKIKVSHQINLLDRIREMIIELKNKEYFTLNNFIQKI